MRFPILPLQTAISLWATSASSVSRDSPSSLWDKHPCPLSLVPFSSSAISCPCLLFPALRPSGANKSWCWELGLGVLRWCHSFQKAHRTPTWQDQERSSPQHTVVETLDKQKEGWALKAAREGVTQGGKSFRAIAGFSMEMLSIEQRLQVLQEHRCQPRLLLYRAALSGRAEREKIMI